jgi:hypothetical protein
MDFDCELPNALQMSSNASHSLSAKIFRWLGSIGQESHPESLRNILIGSGMRPLDSSLTEVEVDVLISRLERGDPLGARRLRPIKTVTYPDLKELRWRLTHSEQNSALRLYLADEPLNYSGLRWHIKALEQDSEVLRLQQNLEISKSVIAFLENGRKSN